MVWFPKETLQMPKLYFLHTIIPSPILKYLWGIALWFPGVAFRSPFYTISQWTYRIKISVWLEVFQILNICKNNISFVTIYEIYILISAVDVFSSFHFLNKNFEFLSEIFFPVSPILYLYVQVFIYFLYKRLIFRLTIQGVWSLVPIWWKFQKSLSFLICSSFVGCNSTSTKRNGFRNFSDIDIRPNLQEVVKESWIFYNVI
jgi:hypothetical protein